jgi:proteasome accessory factor A
LEDGRFALCEKATGTKRLYRWNLGAEQRALFDDGNLLKQMVFGLLDIFARKTGRIKRLGSESQRFQLGMSDSNMAQMAEYLKIGVSDLVLALAQCDALDDAPILVQPMAALRKINGDPSLSLSVKTKAHGMLRALDIQRWYLDRAKDVFLADVVSLERKKILELWEECLNTLEDNPAHLFGRIDWITKSHLIQKAGEGLAYTDQKRIDLQYHELGSGFFVELECVGLALQIIDPADIEEAMYKPSSPQKVQQRVRYIKKLADADLPVSINWDSVHIGSWGEREVIDLNRYRRNRNKT